MTPREATGVTEATGDKERTLKKQPEQYGIPREATGGDGSHGSHGSPGAHSKETAKTIGNKAGDHGRPREATGGDGRRREATPAAHSREARQDLLALEIREDPYRPSLFGENFEKFEHVLNF